MKYVLLFIFKVERSRVSSDEDADSDGDSYDEQLENIKVVNKQGSTSALVHKLTSKRKKRVLPKTSRGSTAKRARKDNGSSSIVNQDELDDNQSLSSALKELNNNFLQLRKQVAGLASAYDQQKQLLKLVLNHQKKMVKAMRNHQVKKLDFNKLYFPFASDSNCII